MLGKITLKPHQLKNLLKKFDEKRIQLFKQSEQDPNDLVVKKQIQYINSLLERGNESSWPTIWHEWEKNNFCWPMEQIIPERVRKID